MIVFGNKNIGYILVLYSSALSQELSICAKLTFVFSIHSPTSTTT